MFKSIGHEEYKKRLIEKEINAIPLEEYITAKTKIKHLCLKHNEEFMAKPDSLFNGRFPCPLCKKEKKDAIADTLRRTHEDYEKAVFEVNPYIKLLEKYKNGHTPITYMCRDCGYVDTVFADNLLRQRECVNCGKRPNAISDDEFKKRLYEKNPNISYTGKLKNLNSVLHFKCNVDNEEWDDIAHNVLISGCKVCNGSRRNTFTYKKQLKELNSFVIPIDEYQYANKKITHKCQKCGYEFKESPVNLLGKLNKNLGICPMCSDGISYPNKISHFLLSQLSSQLLSYQCEYSPEWCVYIDFDNIEHNGRYDNYVVMKNGDKIIIEMDGGFHSYDNTLSGQSKELSQYIDKQKDSLAALNGCKVIRVDCNYENKDRFEYIKNNILSNEELNKIFDFSNINWNEILVKCEKSYFLESCKMWDNGETIDSIANNFGLCIDTIRGYLNRGSKNGLCTYDAQEEYKKSFIKIRNKVSKSCICIETNKTFKSIVEAGRYYNIEDSSISECCRGNRKSAGGKTWAFYDEENEVAI